MAHSFFTTRWPMLFFILLPLLISSACNTSVSTPPPSEPSPTSPPEEATSEQPGELTLQQEMVFGPGSFIYTDTRAGLANLTSYQASLTLTFDGTRDGQASKWSQTYTLLARNEPSARTWTLERSGDLPNLEPMFLAEMNGLDYERRGELECTATEIQAGDSLTDRFELASFLTGVIGAEEAGSETVNGVAANHYTFDQRALGEDGITESTGEIWVASEGNYIVKYLLTRKGKADYFGEGIEGTLTLDYQLTDPNQPVTIQLPEDCPPGLVDAPLLPDAANVEKMPGALTYDTSAGLAEAAAFYQEQIPSLGWTLEGEPSITESAAFLNYKKDSQSMVIFLSAGDNMTTVHILLENSQE